MALAGLSFFTVPGPSTAEPVYGAGLIVVWMRGSQPQTDGALCQTLARAIALDRLSIVLDLSEVNLIERVDTRGHRGRPGAPQPAVTLTESALPIGLRPAHHRRLRLGQPPRSEHPTRTRRRQRGPRLPVAIPVVEAADREAHPSSTTALTRLPADHAVHLLHH